MQRRAHARCISRHPWSAGGTWRRMGRGRTGAASGAGAFAPARAPALGTCLLCPRGVCGKDAAPLHALVGAACTCRESMRSPRASLAAGGGSGVQRSDDGTGLPSLVPLPGHAQHDTISPRERARRATSTHEHGAPMSKRKHRVSGLGEPMARCCSGMHACLPAHQGLPGDTGRPTLWPALCEHALLPPLHLGPTAR